MKHSKTSRGFPIISFADLGGEPCSAQDSSSAERDCMWLGMQRGSHIHGLCLARMHVDRKLAKKLIAILQRFVDTGSVAVTRRKKSKQ